MFNLKTINRKMPKLDVILESGEFHGVKLRGRTPTMAYKDGHIDKISEAIHSRFKLDDTTSSVIQATKVLNLRKWPLKDNEKLTGPKMLNPLSVPYVLCSEFSYACCTFVSVSFD